MDNKILKTILKTAELAKLEPSGSDSSKLIERAINVIDYFNVLNEIDTSDIGPMSHAVDIKTGLRKDEVIMFDNVSGIINQAPEKDGEFLLVPKVI